MGPSAQGTLLSELRFLACHKGKEPLGGGRVYSRAVIRSRRTGFGLLAMGGRSDRSRIGGYPCTRGFQIQTRNALHLPADADRVANWITDGRWIEGSVRQEVAPQHACAFLSIHLPVMQTEDTLLWPYTANGSASVRSVYHRLCDRQLPAAPRDEQGREA